MAELTLSSRRAPFLLGLHVVCWELAGRRWGRTSSASEDGGSGMEKEPAKSSKGDTLQWGQQSTLAGLVPATLSAL